MKFSFEMLAVAATSPPTSILAPGPIRIPFGLTRKTVPFAVSRPRIADISGPVTRFSVAPVPACRKLTCPPVPMLKLRQSMTARCEDWTMSRRLPFAVIVADPAFTTPPCGFAVAPAA